jgi:hypothetical protein
MKRTNGGVGSNQYTRRNALSSTPTAPADPELLAQATPSLADQRVCGAVWGGKCQRLVDPPDYTHPGHPALAAKVDRASSPDAHPIALMVLSRNTRPDIRSAVASNPSATPDILSQLATDTDDSTRCWVAAHHSTPIPVLESLASDHKDTVRYEVARNERTPIAVLEQLLQDRSLGVSHFAANNPSVPQTTRAAWQLSRGATSNGFAVTMIQQSSPVRHTRAIR